MFRVMLSTAMPSSARAMARGPASSGRKPSDPTSSRTCCFAAGHDLKRFLAATGWGRRHAPCGSLVALSGQTGRLAAPYL